MSDKPNIISDREFLEGYMQDSHPYVDSVTTSNPGMVIENNGANAAAENGIPLFMDEVPDNSIQRDLMKHLKGTPINTPKKPSLIQKFFSNFSRYGMNYDDDVIGNMRALPADPKILPKPVQMINSNIYSTLSSKWQVKSNAEKDFYEKDLPIKRESLRKLALQPELEDILDTMTNECVVYDSDNAYFAEPFVDDKALKDFKEGVQKKIRESVESNYYRFYKMLNWKYNAWDDFKRFLIEGSLAWEIIYDSLEKPHKIIGLIPLDPATLTKSYNNGKIYWIQFKGITGKERKLLDAQVIYIQYQENVVARQSYLERLIRPYNVYRIIEQAQIIWTITNASYKMKFTIPVQGMNKTNGMQTLRSAMQRYREDIKFNSDSGELTINGQTNLPFNKEYWFPETDSGSPQVETIGGDGPDLNDYSQLKFFKNQLYKMSKIPLSRFDDDSGQTFFGTDVTSMARDEINFGRFVTRLRNVFSRILIKPMQLQLALDIPEVREMPEILDAIQLRWQSYNLFEEMFEQEIMQKRVEFIQMMKDSLVDMDTQGNEVKFFSSEFLVRKYLKLSDADLKLNKKYSERERKEAQEFSDEEGSPEEDAGDNPNSPAARKDDDLIIDNPKKKKKKEPEQINDDSKDKKKKKIIVDDKPKETHEEE